MKHAREDYNRFQEPDELLECIAMLESFAQSGEVLNDDDREKLRLLRHKYRATRTGSRFGEDEPVMLFRAQDEHFVELLDFYAWKLEGKQQWYMAKVVREHAKEAEAWQKEHGCKTPDMPKEAPTP